MIREFFKKLTSSLVSFFKRFLTVMYTKATAGFFISIIVSFIFAFIINCFYQFQFDISPVKGGLCLSDISFFGIIVVFRFVFSVLLELFLGDSVNIPIGDLIFKVPDTMVDIDEAWGSPSAMQQDSPSSTGQTSSSPTGQGSSSDPQEGPGNKMSSQEKGEFVDSLKNNLEIQEKMVKKLVSIKDEHDIKLYLENDDLDMAFPAEMSEQKYSRLRKEIGIIDRILNTKFEEYKNLENKDINRSNGWYTKTLMNPRITSINEKYKSLFEKDS